MRISLGSRLRASQNATTNALWLEILLQMTREFFFPVLITIGWVAWDGRDKDDYDYVGKFSLLIMSISYVFLQWHRIKKQLRTDRGLSTLEHSVAHLLEQMGAATKDIVGYSTGGDSVCWLEPLNQIDSFLVNHRGKYPLRNVSIRVVDLDRFASSDDQLSTAVENVLDLDLIIPGHIRFVSLISPMGQFGNKIRGFNIFITTPSGSYRQLLRVVKIDDTIKSAILLENDEGTILEKIDDDFPREEDGTVQWNTQPTKPS